MATTTAVSFSTTDPPFALAHQLSSEELADRTFSGQSRVPACIVLDLLDREFCSAELDVVAPRLWWMSKQDSSSISPLHRQAIKRRSVVVTEDPKLHLVWIHDRIFIKPMPRYIGSFVFWKQHLSGGRHLRKGSREYHIRSTLLGFLRTYTHLIQHESDFRIAQDTNLCLLPPNITWEQFCNFASDLAHITDQDVSERYHYGEIRLTRLNFYAPFLLRKSNYQQVEYQYETYFSRFYAPLLFIIAMVSIILNGLQVSLAARQALTDRTKDLLFDVALWFGMAMVTQFCAVLLYFWVLWSYKIIKEWNFAIRNRLRLLEEGRAGFKE